MSVFAVLLSICVHAEDRPAAGLAGPILGFIWQASDAQVLPVRGMPGSALIGAPLDPGFDIAHALPLDGRYVLVAAASPPLLMTIDVSASMTPRVISDSALTPVRSAASAHGSAAALHDAGRRRLVIVTGLPAHPRIAATIDVTHVDAPLTHLAVNDSGTLLVYAVERETLTSLHSWTPDSGIRLVVDLESVSAIALAASDLLVATPMTSEILIVRDPTGTARWTRFAGASQGIAAPRGIAVVGSRVYVADANAASGTIVTFDDRGRVLARQACNCELTGLYRLQESIYRLTASTTRTMFLLDARTGPARISFVPPAARLDSAGR